MSGSSDSSSFIPKRGGKRNVRKVRNFNIYVLSVISYVLFFSALIISGAVYFYENSVRSQLTIETTRMNDAIANFREVDMRRVESFAVRLEQANERLENSGSVVSVLEAIEETLSDTVVLSNLLVERDFDTGYIIQAQAETDSYDSAIFQRETLLDFDPVEAVEIREVTLDPRPQSDTVVSQQRISLLTLISIPLSEVPYVVRVIDTDESNNESAALFFDEEFGGTQTEGFIDDAVNNQQNQQ